MWLTTVKNIAVTLTVFILAPAIGFGQEAGSIRGSVTFNQNDQPVQGAVVLLVGTTYVALTDNEGNYEFTDVPTGNFEVIAQREHLSAMRQSVTIAAGAIIDLNFALDLSGVHEELTVTAAAWGQTTAFDAFNSVTTLDSFEITANPQTTLGDVLENEPGVAKRSFGPGSSRPIIRGFDGDRVLIMQDGVRTGDLSAASGDHGVTIDPNGLERVEIVRGPATLLYGSNAVGGVVNTITPHESYRETFTTGTRGQYSVDVGTADTQMGTNVNLQHAWKNAVIWAGGGSRRTDDYITPAGVVENSATELSSGRAGLGYFGDRFFASGGFTMDDGRYGIPFAGDFHHRGHGDDHNDHEDEVNIDLESGRRVHRFDLGMRNLDNAAIDGFRVIFNVIDWQQDELEIEDGLETLGTAFNNQTFVTRTEIDQRQLGPLSGTFGFWTQSRDYVATGEEALAPATDQRSMAAFAYEELNFGRYRLQFGGRVEANDFTVAEHADEHHDNDDHGDDLHRSEPRDRNFLGASTSVGFRANLGADTAFVTNLTQSHRAPALEELYNYGPHVGSLMFEVGNTNLKSETTLGLDTSLRYQGSRARATFNAYTYSIHGFVFASMEDDHIVGGLRVGEFLQADSRFTGIDAEASVRLGDRIWANVGLGAVNAEVTTTGDALPRIPPLRGRFSLELPYQSFSLRPEIIVAAAQDRVSRGETRTAGYATANLQAAYTWTRPTMAHVVSFTAYNLNDRLYRNHTSFIKDLAPEIGRGFRLGYSVRFF